MTLTAYKFEIFYKSKRTNFANESSKFFNYKEISTLNIKLLLLLQSKFTLLIKMQDSEKIFNDAFELINVQKLEFVLNAKSFIKIFENALTRLNAQKSKLSTNVWNFSKMFLNVSTRLNAYFELNIKYLSSS